MSDTHVPNVIPTPIEDEIQTSYMTYAMSVIVSRALPDARDGLKPVHRRILFAQKEMNNVPDQKLKKCAAIVGEVMGKFHPHGNDAIYSTLVRMAQNFSMRYMLEIGQGNFGSIDGYPPAAMRYTECKMSHIAMELLKDIDKNTVDFMSNYDDSLTEPKVLPSALPNLLINGSNGIAVGMSTNMPPHNMGEVIDGVIAFIENREISIAELVKYIKGPDFPTGGIIRGNRGIIEAYHSGRGKVVIEAKIDLEETKGGRTQIVVSEIPYMVNKSQLLQKMGMLAVEKKIDGISFVRDESDKKGLRIVVEVKKGFDPIIIKNQLLMQTYLRSSFGIINLALIDNRPKVFNLLQLIETFVKHRKEVIVRRSQYDLEKAQQRAHILEGLIKAIQYIDEVIQIIRQAKTTADAKSGLMDRFEFSEVQAMEILRMPLMRLPQMETEKLVNELEELSKLIAELKEILASDAKQFEVMKTELLDAKKRYGDPRRTMIEEAQEDIEIEDLIADEDAIVTISMNGYIKRMPENVYRKQRRGGIGKTGGGNKNDDLIRNIIGASTHDFLLFFSNKGNCYFVKVYQIPEASRIARGKSLKLILNLAQDEEIRAFLKVRDFDESINIVMATKKGVIKKTSLIHFHRARLRGIRAIKLDEGDEIKSVLLTTGTDEIMLLTRNGAALRMAEKQVRRMGRTARGVRGIRLRKDDELFAMIKVDEEHLLLPITESGYGKTVEFSQFMVHGRGTGGQMFLRANSKTGLIVTAIMVHSTDEVVIITERGMVIRVAVSEINTYGRTASGLRIVKVKAPDKVVDVARVLSSESEDGIEGLETGTNVIDSLVSDESEPLDTTEEPDME